MKYIHKYASFLNYSSIIRKTYPDISLITESNNFVIVNHRYNQYEHKCHKYKHKYLTFEILTAGTIIWKMMGSNATKTIEYSLNDGSWTEITSTSSGISISVSQGDIIKFRGLNSAYAKDKTNYSAFYEGTATYNAYGNIMSLIYGDNFEKQKKLTEAWALSNLFNHSNIVSAENLLMPATILTNDCYRATFANSPLLTIAPDLPAITLTADCYQYMFDKCTSLIKAPELLAKTLVTNCYYGMFHICSSLNYIKCLATNISASNCTKDWIGNSEGTVAETGTFVKDPNMTNWTTTGFNGIPSGWTVIDYNELVDPIITCFGDVVEITCQTPNADIYYDLNESGIFTKYTAPIEINGNTIIDAYSELNNQTSNIISQTCTYVYESKLAASNKSIETWTYNNQTIQTPYSVNAIDGHSGNYSKGTFNFETTIILKRVQPTYLWFQHADQSAEIYVDNVLVTKHWGGYNAFFIDITNYIHIGTNNIKVALKNNEGNNLAPCSADFNFNATLGKVKVLTSPVMPDMFYGYDGFHITATNVSSASAILTIKTSIPSGATVVCKIDDDESNYHFYDEKPSTGSEMSFITTISNPTLWNGKINPHLYNVTLEIYKNGDLYHRFERGYGIRYYSYVYNYTLPNNETYTGFLLNGSPYLLRGVCMHDDLEGKANALNDNDYTQEFAMIQEVGCNFIRLAHYPHPKEVYDWCDRLGIIVQTEVPLVNNIKSTQPEDYYTHLEGQYYDMVTQHYNHPCIMFWGLGNEFNAQMDSDGGTFACTKLEYFRDIIKTYDTERMVGCVLNGNSSNPRSTVGGADLDWYGCNIYVGWYSSTSSNNPTSQINTRLNNVTNRPIAYSEYGCGGTQCCHSETPSSTTNKGSGGARHDIEYQMWYHEGHIAAIKNFPQLIFTAEWQFFDVAVSGRNEGYTVCLDGETTSIDDNLRRLNDKGLVERDHITKKDTFYLYKAWWNQTDKFVHICGKDYQKIDNRVIKCYTNDGDSLSLYVNNTFIETVIVTNNIASFTARTYSPEDIIKVQGATTNDIFTIDINYSSEYLTFNIKSDGDIIWKANDNYTKTISYSKNGGSWIDITSTTAGESISVVVGDKIRFKGSNSSYCSSINYRSNSFNSTATFNVYGNIMSLISGDNFINTTSFSSTCIFTDLFKSSKVISAKNLILPVITMTDSCYRTMFSGCTLLTTPPNLPATTLAQSCYIGMFSSCTSLTIAPLLPATSLYLADYCYSSMFSNCTSLTTAPELPATTLAVYCYSHMFYGCTSLTAGPSILPATTLTYSCYRTMFENCTSLTAAPELPATILTSDCYEDMFKNCTSLVTAPELPATTLEIQCYQSMFYGCTSLNYIKCLAIDKSKEACVNYWVYNVALSGTFIKNPDMESWTTGVSGIPSGWTVQDAS